MPEIKNTKDHTEQNIPESQVEKLFKSIGIGFNCKAIYIDNNNSITITGILKSYDMANRKLVITQSGKDKELDMNYISEISAFTEADIVPPTRKARLDRLKRLGLYLSYHTNPSRKANTPIDLSSEFGYIDDYDISYFQNNDADTIINQLEASEGVSPYRKEKFSDPIIKIFSRLADGVK